MLIILIPLIPFICSVVLLSLESEKRLRRHARYIVASSSLATLLLAIWLTINTAGDQAIEYLFSQLFKLPGSSESLSFSLFFDSTSAIWLLLMSLFCFGLTFLGSIQHSSESNQQLNLGAIQMAHAGVATLCLSGSLVSVLLGWGIMIAAVILASIHSKNRDNRHHGLGFMILMISIFFLLSSIYFLYGTMGKLSFTNDPQHLKTTLIGMMATHQGSIINSVINMTGICLLLGIFPLLGLVPFTPWLDDLRSAHPLNRLTVLLVILPSGILILQRYAWFLSLTSLLRISLAVIAIITLVLAILACFSQKGGKLTLPWMAVTGTAMLTISITAQSYLDTNYILYSIYLGFFIFCAGRFLTLQMDKSSGRYIQIIGLATIPITSFLLPFLNSAFRPESLPMSYLFNLVFLVPAILVFRHSDSTRNDAVSFSSSMGWAAFKSYGMSDFLIQAIAMPIQQISHGFWTLETYYNQFWQHGLGKGIKNISRLLCLFDHWFIDGATHWMKRAPKHPGNERTDRP